MKKIIISEDKVEIFNNKKQQWESCSFYEAGLYNNNPGFEIFDINQDLDKIIEHIEGKIDVNCSITVEK